MVNTALVWIVRSILSVAKSGMLSSVIERIQICFLFTVSRVRLDISEQGTFDNNRTGNLKKQSLSKVQSKLRDKTYINQSVDHLGKIATLELISVEQRFNFVSYQCSSWVVQASEAIDHVQ